MIPKAKASPKCKAKAIPKGKAQAKAKARPPVEPISRRRALFTEEGPTRNQRARARARSADNVRAAPSHNNPEAKAQPKAQSSQGTRRVLRPTFQSTNIPTQARALPKLKTTHPNPQTEKKGGSIKNTIEDIIETSNLPPRQQALLPKKRLTTKVARTKHGQTKKPEERNRSWNTTTSRTTLTT